uniref:60S ribosomal export protein NMD3 n=1 Tax=Oryza punctata TaxID=4537 RepID=A0A0E0K3C8_ORYPU
MDDALHLHLHRRSPELAAFTVTTRAHSAATGEKDVGDGEGAGEIRGGDGAASSQRTPVDPASIREGGRGIKNVTPPLQAPTLQLCLHTATAGREATASRPSSLRLHLHRHDQCSSGAAAGVAARTLLHLEQQIFTHGAAGDALRVGAARGGGGGLDFFFASRSHAARLVDLVTSLSPARVIASKQLVSHDSKSSSYDMRHTFAVEFCPVCRDDLIFLPKEAGLGPIVLCLKVTNTFALLDTSTLRVVHLGIKEYDRCRFEPVLTSRQLVECGSARRTAARCSTSSSRSSPTAPPSASARRAAAAGSTFFFASRSHAASLVDLVTSLSPARVIASKQLVSHDSKSSSYDMRHTFAVEFCPVCRDDLIFLPKEAGLGPIVLCLKVTNTFALLDTSTLRVVHLGIKEYDRCRFEPVLTSRQLVEYVVLDVDHEPAAGGVAYAQVARVFDFVRNDTIFTVRTHLGHILNAGDHALGYDLYGINVNNHDVERDGKHHGDGTVPILQNFRHPANIVNSSGIFLNQ